MSAQDDLISEFSELATGAKALAKRLSAEPHRAYISDLQKAVREMELAASGSWIGYHACIYLEGFRARSAGDVFDAFTGPDALYSRMQGPWKIFEREDIRRVLLENVIGPDGKQELIELATEMKEYFLDMKASMMALLDALLSHYKEPPLKELRDALEKLEPFINASDIVKLKMPRRAMSQDTGAMAQGIKVPPHIEVEAWLMQIQSHAHQLNELARLALRGAKYVDRKTRLSVGGMLNQLKETFVSDKKDKQGERKIRAGRGATVIAGDNTTFQQANKASPGGSINLVAGDASLAPSRLEDSVTLEQAQFNKDVTEILHALTAAKESLEADQAVLVQFFASLLGLNVQGKTVGELKAELSEKIASSPARPALQRVSSQATPIIQGIVSNVLFSSVVQPVLAALAAVT